jgi:hypothetical protein
MNRPILALSTLIVTAMLSLTAFGGPGPMTGPPLPGQPSSVPASSAASKGRGASGGGRSGPARVFVGGVEIKLPGSSYPAVPIQVTAQAEVLATAGMRTSAAARMMKKMIRTRTTMIPAPIQSS